MKNSKIGLLVHPFWMTLNGKKHLEHYSKIITSNNEMEYKNNKKLYGK